MNKRANRKAFFICIAICLIYVSLGIRLPEKISTRRIADGHEIKPKNMNLSITKSTPDITHNSSSTQTIPNTAETTGNTPDTTHSSISQNVHNVRQDESLFEPSFFISIPIVCLAIKEGIIEREGLIFIKKGGYNNMSCKKPIDILKDRDEEGLKSIAKIIGKKQLLDILKKEGVTHQGELNAEDIILGKNYRLEKKKILSFYHGYVSDDYNRLFPFVVGSVGIIKNKGDFTFIHTKDGVKEHHADEDSEWLMPNLVNLSMKTAIEKLTMHTSKIKVYGSGNVVEQYPKPFEKTRGETECVIYGRTYK